MPVVPISTVASCCNRIMCLWLLVCKVAGFTYKCVHFWQTTIKKSEKNRGASIKINWLSVTSDYERILARMLGSSKNGRLEATPFSVPTISETISVIRKDAKRNTSGLTAPGSLNTCPMCEGQRWIFKVPTILLWYRRPPSLGLNPNDLEFLKLKACWWQCCNLLL